MRNRLEWDKERESGFEGDERGVLFFKEREVVLVRGEGEGWIISIHCFNERNVICDRGYCDAMGVQSSSWRVNTCVGGLLGVKAFKGETEESTDFNISTRYLKSRDEQKAGVPPKRMSR